jgi:hypothetical protein
MRTSRMMLVPGALLLAASAGAQQRSPAAAPGHFLPPAAHPAATAPRPAAAAMNGAVSKWGGSPPERRHDRDQRVFFGQTGAYIPIAVAAPYPVAAVPDTACAPAPDASVEMPVITSRHEDRQLTTIEVYRLQPRFQKP